MKHLSIILPQGHIILDTVVATMNLFSMANHYAKRLGKYESHLFAIDLVGIDHNPVTYHRYFQVTPTKSIQEVTHTDVIILSSVTGNMDLAIAKNEPFIRWIREQRVKNDAEVVSLCRSAFLLAETGLLNGKSCATHWAVHEQFEKKYTDVHLHPDKIITKDEPLNVAISDVIKFLNVKITHWSMTHPGLQSRFY